tara:strand:- start:54 stop:353 length:300 start_codon:yes stop_codon:yes gene_type:complete
MNPIAFLFSSLKSVHYETVLLEACDWSDQRVEEVKLLFEDAVSDLMLTLNKGSIDSITSEIESKLSQDLESKEVEACLLILKESIDSFLKSERTDSYDN